MEQQQEYHKGAPCPYSRDFVFCQETPCGTNCQIYLDWHERWKDIENKMDYTVGR